MTCKPKKLIKIKQHTATKEMILREWRWRIERLIEMREAKK